MNLVGLSGMAMLVLIFFVIPVSEIILINCLFFGWILFATVSVGLEEKKKEAWKQ